MIKDTNNLKEETQKIRIATIGAAQKLRALDISIKALRDATNKREADYEKELKLLLKKQERIKKILDKNYDTDEKINVSEASKNNHGALRAGEIQVVKDIEEMQKTIEQNKELSRVEKTKYAEVINKIEKTELPEDQNTTNTERAILNILNTISRDLQQIYQGALRTYELREDPERAIDEKKRNYDQKLPKLRENVDLLAENYKSFLIRLMKLTETLQEIEKIFGVNVKMMTNQLNPNVNVPPPRTKGPLDVHFSHGPGRFV
jgi:hypothetical protein